MHIAVCLRQNLKITFFTGQGTYELENKFKLMPEIKKIKKELFSNKKTGKILI